MCLALYIASDEPLPTVARDEGRRAFHVGEAIHGPHNSVLRHVSKRLLYSAGSHGGCGCGFEFNPLWENDEGEIVATDSPEQTAARRDLADYLSAALQLQATVEVFGCCSGDEDFPPNSRRRSRPADFIHDRTLFRYGELVVVSE